MSIYYRFGKIIKNKFIYFLGATISLLEKNSDQQKNWIDYDADINFLKIQSNLKAI